MTNFSHSKDPISIDPSHIGGYSRQAGYASYETKIAVINAIKNMSAQYGLSQKDIANLIAIAKLESGFNPDAATARHNSSASGVMQVTDTSAKDVIDRLNGSSIINGHQLGIYDRFIVDPDFQTIV